jgi:hypothetical protein
MIPIKLNFAQGPESFWDENPHYRFYDYFAELYNADKSQNKRLSASKAFCACVLWHRNSPYKNTMTENELIILIEENLIQTPKYYTTHREQFTRLKESLNKSKTIMQKYLEDLEDKLEERMAYIKTTSYLDPTNGGANLDKMIINTENVIKAVQTLAQRVEEEDKNADMARGGAEQSAVDQGLI